MSIEEIIKKYEGLNLKPYRCSSGKLTIGYGFNLDNGITQEIADYLLMYKINESHHELCEIFRPKVVTQWSDSKYIALIDLMFNLGKTKFLTFKKMIQAIKEGDWDRAADELLESKYANQVGQRAIDNAERLRKG